MEWVDGVDLRELLRRDGRARRRSRPSRSSSDVAAALDVAHAAGLVHRDVKPANILVARRASALLCDFGLAKHAASAESLTGERDARGDGRVHRARADRGRRRRRAAPTSTRSAACCTSASPASRRSTRESELAVLYAHLNEPPPRPSDRRPELPTALDDVVAAALAKAPRRARRGAAASWRARRSAALRGEAPRRRGAAAGPSPLAAAAASRSPPSWRRPCCSAAARTSVPAQPQLQLGPNVLAAVDASSGRVVRRVRLPGPARRGGVGRAVHVGAARRTAAAWCGSKRPHGVGIGRRCRSRPAPSRRARVACG